MVTHKFADPASRQPEDWKHETQQNQRLIQVTCVVP